MYAALTVRRLKPGSYDEWRKAWDPSHAPEGGRKAYILRKLGDEDEVIAFGFFDGDLQALRADPAFQDEQKERFDAMAPFVESTGADGLYEVVDEVDLSAT
jgi:hypothetical protein